MKTSSIRSLSISAGPGLLRALVSLGWLLPVSSYGLNTHYSVNVESRLAYHAFAPQDIASHRHTLDAQQKFEFSPKLNAVAGFRAYAEGAFAHNDGRFGATVRRNESFDISARDFYLEYQGRASLIRVGNQQVVWGEAFGFYYADIVNPKDLREFGLGDLSAQRIPVPMVNTVLFMKNTSLQLLYVVKPYFNKIASMGGDFAAPFESFFPGTTVSVVDDRSKPIQLTDGEYGVRFGSLVSGYDFGVFFFSYFDRRPSYSTTFTSPTQVTFLASHPRIHSVGFTVTKDFPQFMARFESLYTRNRRIDQFDSAGYRNYLSDEWTAAIELDWTRFTPWRLGTQLSETYLSRFQGSSLQPRHQTLISANLKGNIWKDHSLENILSYSILDGSTFNKLQYTLPTSQQFELIVGIDLFLGGNRSRYGQIRNASRGYVMLKGYLAK